MTRAGAAGGVASLAMYPFDETRSATDVLWAAVHRLAPWTPSALDWPDDVHQSWSSPQLVVGQTCGWPLVTRLGDNVRVVGAFEPTIPQGVGATYRSVLVARRPAPVHDFRGTTAAVNGLDSLSGWVSLIAAVEHPGGSWSGTVRLTGAHVESIRAVRDGEADVASIDSVTWALVRRHRPASAEGLVEVGEGPQVPCLPVIAGAQVTDDQVSQLRAAFADAVRTEPDAAAALLVAGFVPYDLADYLPLLALTPTA